MDTDYLEILKEWTRSVGRPALYENLDRVFPEYHFRRMQKGSGRDHWASRYKLDLTLPKKRNAEKTVVYPGDMQFREQGEWSEGIDVLSKLMQDRGLQSIKECFVYLDNLLVLGMPQPDSKDVLERRQYRLRKKSLLESLQQYFSAALWDMNSRSAGKVRSYLSSIRGFTKKQCHELSFGFVPAWDVVVRHFTVNLGYSIGELDDVCGVRNSEGRTSVGSIYTLAIPYTTGGEVCGFLFRRIGEGSGPKYMATRGLDRKSRFFNIPSSVPDGHVIIVEGELDALKVSAAGLGVVAAIGGSEISGDRRRQVEDAVHRGVRRFTLALDLDPDNSGHPNYAARHEHLMKTIHTIKDVDQKIEDIYVVQFEEPTDPDEFVRVKGGAAFSSLVNTAKPWWEYLHGYMSLTTQNAGDESPAS